MDDPIPTVYNNNNKPLCSWTKEEVQNWFNAARGGKWQRYSHLFVDYDGEMLAGLKEYQLLYIIQRNTAFALWNDIGKLA